jgi:hypothetical protein
MVSVVNARLAASMLEVRLYVVKVGADAEIAEESRSCTLEIVVVDEEEEEEEEGSEVKEDSGQEKASSITFADTKTETQTSKHE